MHSAVIGRGGHKRVRAVEGDGTDSLGMIFKSLEGEGGEVQVEPDDTSVIRRDDYMVSRWVDVEGGDPLAACKELLDQHLLEEVVYPDVGLCGHEKEGFVGVERQGLDGAVCLSERALRLALADLVNHD
eukprot:evm.model.NODE_12427_length_6345_cov_28.242395.1